MDKNMMEQIGQFLTKFLETKGADMMAKMAKREMQKYPGFLPHLLMCFYLFVGAFLFRVFVSSFLNFRSWFCRQ